MTRIALLGAGFTRNWGGWLASELIGELCGRLIDRPNVNQLLRLSGNFEQVLAARRALAEREPSNEQALEDVRRLEEAILTSFASVNAALARLPDLRLSGTSDMRCSIRQFLARFDAIFTLNQDLLLELHYDGMGLESRGRWQHYYFPGIVLTRGWLRERREERVGQTLLVGNVPVAPPDRYQPVFKLHGSVNWRTDEGGRVLVVGTAKEKAAPGSELLRWYHEEFRRYLMRVDTRIMVIGYGFADQHINSLLLDAAKRASLAMYLVDPKGREALSAHPELMLIPLLGFCQRRFGQVFEDPDSPAFQSIDRFFSDQR